jgi:nicotinamidase-related amidase/catechol 2,3-dioxygenase-like lactoylglutathione lyase family enzyme
MQSEATLYQPTFAMKLELVPLPVADVDRAKAFYVDQVGFHLDHDGAPGNGMRIVQLTPPGSACSVVFGTGMPEVSDVPPGSIKGLHLVVDDIAVARQALIARGVDVAPVDDMGGILYAYFADPDGNSWLLQQIPPEFRGGRSMTVPDARTALILIDVQRGFDDPRLGPRNNPDAEASMARLLAAWRAAGRPVVHIRHMSTEPESPLRPGTPGNAFKPVVAPLDGEPVFEKSVNSAFIGTGLEAYLREAGITSLVMAGLTTDHCVSTSARMAGNLGFTTVVVADATATFDRTGHDGVRYDAETVHRTALASLHGEFAAVVRVDDLLG